MIAAWLLAAVLYIPNPSQTPGAVRPEITAETACSTRWGLDQRHVTTRMKKDVAIAYGVPWADRHDYEFDHLVPRELGGADDVRNLWPQPRHGQWDAGKKDKLENRLRRMVCRGELQFRDAQDAIRTDWIAAYRRYVVVAKKPH